jgi:transcription initiation factor TFIID subunit 11
MSLVSGSVAGGKKKRGRKPKGAADDASLVGGRALTAVSGTSGRNRRNISRESVEDDDDVGEALDVAVVARTREEKEKEKQYRAMLVDALDPSQYARFERWRSSKLADSIVRRVRFLNGLLQGRY